MNLALLLVISTIFACSVASPLKKNRRKDRTKYVSPSRKLLDADYRLPTNVVPTHYNLYLQLEEDAFESNAFSGVAEIDISVIETSSSIKLHAKNMEIKVIEVVCGKTILNILWSEIDPITDIITVYADLKQDETCRLSITYKGVLSPTELNGFYKSSYIEGETIHYVASTDFEATNARKAFPCFDEPAFKATFDISITFPQNLNAVANTRVLNTEDVPGTNLTKVTFETTPVMSTYLIAFVISEYTCTQGEPIDGTPTEVCSPPETANARNTALATAPQILQIMEEYTGVSYSSSYIGKLTQISIPEYAAGAMENWGLVTYREEYLLWNEEESSSQYQQYVVTTVAHELSHQWFGDLVTLDWWSDVFLNEGFATYFEYYAPDEYLPDWELPKQFVVEQLQVALESDSYGGSLPLSYDVETPYEIDSRFDVISYDKGGSILRMVRYFLGIDAFKAGLSDYIAKNEFSIGTPTILWESFEPHAQELPTTMVEIMDNWTYKTGYPLLTVTADGNDVIISQEQFLMSGTSDITWYVPVTYTLSEEDSSNTTTRAWLVPGENLTLVGALSNSNWIVLNNEQIGYYRVNYDEELLEQISVALLQPDFAGINVLNRAQIADDLFNLAQAGRKSYSSVLKALLFLKNETEYYPWVSSFYIFNYLLRRVGDPDLKEQFVGYMFNLTEALYASTPFDVEKPDDQVYTLKQSLFLFWACAYGNTDCAEKSKEAFSNYKDNSVKYSFKKKVRFVVDFCGCRPSKNLIDVIYCNGLRYSENASLDFDFLWQKYRNSKFSTEQEIILDALGCTLDKELLQIYLAKTITEGSGIRKQDVYTVYASVISSNSQGIETTFDFATTNYNEFVNYFGGTEELNWLIYTVSNRFTTDEQIQKLQLFAENPNLDEDIRLSALDALANAKNNLKFTQLIKEELKDYFSSIYN